jgi:hypothetical protein
MLEAPAQALRGMNMQLLGITVGFNTSSATLFFAVN